MDKALFQNIVETFGTEPLAGTHSIYSKVLLLPDNSIAVYFVNADAIKKDLEQRNFSWNTHLNVWEKKVSSIDEAKRETEGYPATAAALSQIQ